MKKIPKSPNTLIPKPRKEFDSVGQKVVIARENASRTKLRVGKKIGDPPKYLGKIGRQCWLNTVARLRAMEIEDQADESSVEAFCAAYEEYRGAREVINSKGYTYETLSDRGGFRELKRPEVDIMQSAWSRMRGLLPELCMTPLSRLRASPPDKEGDGEPDPMAEFLQS
jgi:P27 family predicted phage terminase small subunit